MNWLVNKMKWVMLVSGLLTMTMIHAAISPDAALKGTFGDSLSGPLAEIVVRNWGALIALVGAMLVYGAFQPQVRTMVLVVAGLSKLTFIALILTFGTQFLGHQAGVAVAVDSVMVLVFFVYLGCAGRVPQAT